MNCASEAPQQVSAEPSSNRVRRNSVPDLAAVAYARKVALPRHAGHERKRAPVVTPATSHFRADHRPPTQINYAVSPKYDREAHGWPQRYCGDATSYTTPPRVIKRPFFGWAFRTWSREVIAWLQAAFMVLASWATLNLGVELLSEVAALLR